MFGVKLFLRRNWDDSSLARKVRSFPRLLCLIIPLVVVATSSNLAAKGWIKLESENFVILSDAKLKDVQSFALEYAGYRAVADFYFGRKGVYIPRTVLVLFKSKKEMLKVVSKDRDSKLFSFTAGVDGRAITAMQLTWDTKESKRQMTEFETVWLLPRFGWFVPTWISQGSGVALSTTFLSKNQEVVSGYAHPSWELFRRRALIPWDRFFEIHRSSPEYTGDDAYGLYQAQAGGLMSWLLAGRSTGKNIFAQVAQEIRHTPPLEIIQRVTGHDAKELSKAVKKHMFGKDPLEGFAFDPEAVSAGFITGPLEEAERLVVLSDLAASAGNDQLATIYYYQAYGLAPDLPVVIESGARLALKEKDLAEAGRLYEQAIEAGSQNARAYTFIARTRLNDMTRGRDREGDGLPMVLEKAESEVKAALEFEPGLGEAYALLGRIAYLEPVPNKSRIFELSDRVGPDEWGMRIRFYRALIHRRLEAYDSAKFDFEAVINHLEASPRDVRKAESQLLSMMDSRLVKTVNQHVADQKYDEAKLFLIEELTTSESKAATDRIEELVQLVESAQTRYHDNQVRLRYEEAARFIKLRNWEKAEAAMVAAIEADVLEKHGDKLRKALATIRRMGAFSITRSKVKEKSWSQVLTLAEKFEKEFPDSADQLKSIKLMKEEAQKNLADSAVGSD